MAEKKAEQFYTRPPNLGKWESFKIFLWNSETNQLLGRTGASWGKILLFYVIFYAVLIGFFAAMLAVFYQTLDPKTPKWQLDGSLIGSNPGLGFRPMPPEGNVESTLIWYRASDPNNIKYWQEQLDDFLKLYQKENNPYGDNIMDCDHGQFPIPGKVCNVKPESWYPCNQKAGYNYNSSEGGPCVFLKLNKIYNWSPEYYNSTTLPGNFPRNMRNRIQDMEDPTNNYNPELLKTVWVSCEGENPADIENMGPINYYPTLGFTGQYFPFVNTDGYLSPLVAVHFERPKRGVLINIECKAWAKNIHHDRADKRGSVHFELMVDY